MAHRVLIVDDSALMRQFLSRVVDAAPGLQVVGWAARGEDALRQAELLRPDVVTMDVEMPGGGGIWAVREIMREIPTPILMISSSTTSGGRATIESLAAGAMDFVAKPANQHDLEQIAATVVEKIGQLAVHGRRTLQRAPAAPAAPARRQAPAPDAGRRQPLVIIGSSTGGPRALFQVVPQLPPGFDACVLVVQHMPPGFTRSLAERLGEAGPLPAREAEDGDLLTKGQVLVAPAGRHLALMGNQLRLTLDPPLHGVRPAVDITLQSAAATHRGPVVAAILTGMGRDGADGAVQLRQKGGYVIAESERTALIYGMPKAVVDAGAADAVCDLDAIAQAIADRCQVPVHGA